MPETHRCIRRVTLLRHFAWDLACAGGMELAYFLSASCNVCTSERSIRAPVLAWRCAKRLLSAIVVVFGSNQYWGREQRSASLYQAGDKP